MCGANGLFLFHTLTYFLSVSREESEKVSELKSVLGSSKLPYGTLASGTEGIRDAINGFDDACVIFSSCYPSSSLLKPPSQSQVGH